jgi:hypothetical protein
VVEGLKKRRLPRLVLANDASHVVNAHRPGIDDVPEYPDVK